MPIVIGRVWANRSMSANGACVGLLLVYKDAQQRRLSASIRADETRAVAGVECEGYALQDRHIAAVFGDAGSLEQSCTV